MHLSGNEAGEANRQLRLSKIINPVEKKKAGLRMPPEGRSSVIQSSSSGGGGGLRLIACVEEVVGNMSIGKLLIPLSRKRARSRWSPAH